MKSNSIRYLRNINFIYTVFGIINFILFYKKINIKSNSNTLDKEMYILFIHFLEF